MSNFKPKETIYNGYRFRSRLEARWAVFFDKAKIRYEYELEGFDLKNGESYLPDFYLSDYELYVEIKPWDPKTVRWVGDNNKWERKCRRFRDITGKAIMICYGDPAMAVYHYLFAFDLTDDSGGSSEYSCVFAEWRGIPVICTEPQRSDRTICISDDFTRNGLIGTPRDFAEYGGDDFWEKSNMSLLQSVDSEKNELYYARIAARQARFEFGETPCCA